MMNHTVFIPVVMKPIYCPQVCFSSACSLGPLVIIVFFFSFIITFKHFNNILIFHIAKQNTHKKNTLSHRWSQCF